ncbi:MAG: hypothetical protein C4326_00935 [Ignavibacteria bacterium]
MKALGFLVACLIFAATSHAQSFISLQAEIAEPTEEFRQTAGTGFGAKGSYLHFLTTRFALGGSLGYVRWNSRTNVPPNNEYRVIAVPIALNADFLLSKSVVAPYIGFSVGMNYLRIRGIAPNANTYEDKNEAHFAYSPHIGVGIHIAGPFGILLVGSYNVIHTERVRTKYFALSVGGAAGL